MSFEQLSRVLFAESTKPCFPTNHIRYTMARKNNINNRVWLSSRLALSIFTQIRVETQLVNLRCFSIYRVKIVDVESLIIIAVSTRRCHRYLHIVSPRTMPNAMLEIYLQHQLHLQYSTSLPCLSEAQILWRNFLLLS